MLLQTKWSNMRKTCSDNRHVFIPFVFDTFVFLTTEVADLLKIVQMVMNSDVALSLQPRIHYTITKDHDTNTNKEHKKGNDE
jgi:hypothetical protein